MTKPDQLTAIMGTLSKKQLLDVISMQRADILQLHLQAAKERRRIMLMERQGDLELGDRH